MTRRDLLKASATVALSSALQIEGRADEDKKEGDGSWRFIAVNDLHYKETACRPWFDTVVAAMKDSAPDAEFCLIGGDLADEGKADQMANIYEAFQALGMPLYATPGNHDYLADTDRSGYDQYFKGHTNQVFTHRGWQIIGLDTSDGTHYKGIQIHQETFDWMDEHFPKLDPTIPTIVWTHFPLGTGVHYRPLNADDLLRRLSSFNVQAAFSGHWHGFTQKIWHDSTLTTDRCCSRVRDNHDGTREKGWFVCTVRDGKVSRQFAEIPQKLRTPPTT